MPLHRQTSLPHRQIWPPRKPRRRPNQFRFQNPLQRQNQPRNLHPRQSLNQRRNLRQSLNQHRRQRLRLPQCPSLLLKLPRRRSSNLKLPRLQSLRLSQRPSRLNRPWRKSRCQKRKLLLSLRQPPSLHPSLNRPRSRRPSSLQRKLLYRSQNLLLKQRRKPSLTRLLRPQTLLPNRNRRLNQPRKRPPQKQRL